MGTAYPRLFQVIKQAASGFWGALEGLPVLV
jgi:hypothetical protein